MKGMATAVLRSALELGRQLVDRIAQVGGDVDGAGLADGDAGRHVRRRPALERSEADRQIAGQRRLKVLTGEFVLARIDARHGAFGIIPDGLDGAVVSNDFPAFRPNPERLLPEYLGWWWRTHDFVEACRTASEGTTNRVRLKEEKFAQIEIPLPPLAEQRRIVEILDQAQRRLVEELLAQLRSTGSSSRRV